VEKSTFFLMLSDLLFQAFAVPFQTFFGLVGDKK